MKMTGLRFCLLMFAIGCHEEQTSATGSGTDFYVIDHDDATGGKTGCFSDNECGAASAAGGCLVGRCVVGECVQQAASAGLSCDGGEGSALPECRAFRCDGVGQCVEAPAVDGTRCGEISSCVQEACKEGACTDKVAVNCDDHNPCTTDTCGAGGCTNAVNTVGCDDGDACTSADACKDGGCKGTPSCECQTNQECDTLDTDKCDGISTCVENVCVNDPKTAPKCVLPGGAGQCESASCNPATGKCSVKVEEYKPCDDGIACTTGDYCTAAGDCVKKTVTCEYECSDKKDDDNDKSIDCDDLDCQGVLACPVLPSCTDNIANGVETGVDCGGLTCPKCLDFQGCLTGVDCLSSDCNTESACSDVCVPAASAEVCSALTVPTSSAHATVPATPAFEFGETASFSVVFRVNFPVGQTGVIAVKGNNSTNEWSVDIGASGQVCLNRQGLANLLCVDASAGAWHHYAVTYAAGAVTWYIDGESKGTGTGNLGGPSASDLTIGNFPGGSYELQGPLDELTIVARALPATEVVALSARTLRPVDLCDLVTHYAFSEATGLVAKGAGAGGYDATLSDTGWSDSCAICSDGLENGDEDEVDCGGSCPDCQI